MRIPGRPRRTMRAPHQREAAMEDRGLPNNSAVKVYDGRSGVFRLWIAVLRVIRVGRLRLAVRPDPVLAPPLTVGWRDDHRRRIMRDRLGRRRRHGFDPPGAEERLAGLRAAPVGRDDLEPAGARLLPR